MSIHQQLRASFLVILALVGLQLLLPLVPLAHADHLAESSVRCATCVELALCQVATLTAPTPPVSDFAPRDAAPRLEHAACFAAPASAHSPARAPPSVLA